MIRVPDPTTSTSIASGPPTAILDLVDATDVAIAGGKASALAALAAHGLPVPDGFVVTEAADLSSPAVVEAIASRLEALEGPVAVRSSSPVEDLSEASYAGIYETVLDVVGVEAALAAIERVRASGRSDRVAAYRGDEGEVGAAVPMAVLVERMVPAEAAGVAFSADPLTGDRTSVLVSAVRGLGDRLVSGESAAEEWTVGPAGASLRSRPDGAGGAIDAAAAQRVAEMVRRVEAIDGVAVDVEWAMADGVVSLLQARPMTALPEVVSWDPGRPGSWMRDLRLGEWLGAPVTALFASWGLTRIERAMDRALASLVGVEMPEPGHVIVNGWYFYGFNFLPTSRVGMVGFFLRHVIPGLILRPRKTSRAIPPLAGLGVRQAEQEWRTEILPGYRALVERSRAEVETADARDLGPIVDALADAAGGYFGSVTQVAGYASKCELPLARFYGAHVRPRIGGSHLDLLVGLGRSPQGIAPHALRSLDWSEPTLGASGAAVGDDAAQRRDEAAQRRHDEAAQRRVAAERAARAALSADPKLRLRFERLLTTAQHYARIREEQIADFSLAWPVMQRAIARIADALVEQRAIDTPEQVHDLTRDEVEDALRSGDRHMAGTAEERRAVRRRQARLVAPLRLGELHPMMARMLDDATAAVRAPLGDAGEAVVGIPASPGRATGPVRVIRQVDEFDRVRPGDILVSPVTAPAYAPLFGIVAAVVTDTGGVAAHASIVAREYGLPAVVGCGDATTRLRDGDLVTVDGSAGTVAPL